MPNEQITAEQLAAIESHAKKNLHADSSKYILLLCVGLRQCQRERDEAVANNSKMVCSYCGEVSEKPQPYSRERHADEILKHIEHCPTHPANKWLDAEARAEKAERELEQLRAAVGWVLASKDGEVAG